MLLRKRFLFLLVLGCAALVPGRGLPAAAQAGPPAAWAARYDEWGTGRTTFNRVVADGSGNVYVTGQFIAPGTSGDYLTIKYDADGNQIWAALYNGPGNSSDSATALAVGADGNVYVTGRSFDTSGRNEDYATVKYDADGNELWVARYSGPINGTDRATALALDDRGNVYVTGQSIGSVTRGSFYDFATIKYDAGGNEVWVARFSGQSDGATVDSATAVAVDGAGSVYVTGYAFGRNLGHYSVFDYATIKYDADGSQLWVRRYNGPANGDDQANALALDALGNVHVTGQSNVSRSLFSTAYDYATIKYDADGNELWVSRHNGPGNGQDSATALAVEASGNIYVTGYSDNEPGSSANLDYATIKYDTEGNEIWVARHNGLGNSTDLASALALDRAGNVYVTGSSAGSGTGAAAYDYATVKYDAQGNELWATRYNGPNDGEDRARSLALDAAGNVYVTGSSGTVKYAAVANLRPTVTDSRRTESGIQLALQLENRGDAGAMQVQLNSVTLAGTSADELPQSLGNIPAGGSATATLTFTGASASGTELVFRVQGSYSGGTFSANQRVVVP